MPTPTSINDNRQRPSLFDSTSFRSSMTSREGHIPGRIMDGKIVGVNMVNWTVDFASTFDRHRLLNIQVASPYLHFSNGEGIYVMPEIGAKCTVCIPSDSSPPFVLCFLMPFEKINDASAPDAPQGTRSHGSVPNFPTDARFDGGRPRAKPGDIFARGRDGNFLILHRGGVLQIGATELAQRIYIPLDNHVMDITERYSHHNVGGSVLWGLAEGQSDDSVVNTEVYRVFADDKYADIRITRGHVLNPISPENPLPDTVIYEVVVSPKGFNADSGDAADSSTAKNVVYQFAMDRSGNISTTVSGDLFCHIKKSLTVKVDDSISVSGKSGSLQFNDGLDVDGGAYAHIKGKLVRLGKGDTAVALKGGLVSVPIAPPAGLGTLAMTGGTLTGQAVLGGAGPGAGTYSIVITIANMSGGMQMALAAPAIGTILNGNETVKA